VVRWTLGDEEFIHRSRASPKFVASTQPPVDGLLERFLIGRGERVLRLPRS